MKHLLRFWHATLVHKYYVYQAGRDLGVGRWQLLIHDLSKFHPAEAMPYARYFYSLPGSGWLKAVIDNSRKQEMLRSWSRHIRRNPHHWQYWLIVNGGSVVASRGTLVDVNPIDPLEMPYKYVLEMLADWMGAGRAYNGSYPQSIHTWQWWQQNKNQLILHPRTKEDLAHAIIAWFHPRAHWMEPALDVEYVWSEPGDGKWSTPAKPLVPVETSMADHVKAKEQKLSEILDSIQREQQARRAREV